MKCISILQPWASLVVTKDPATGKAYKQIETRSWNTKYRGPVLIHASNKWTRDQYITMIEIGADKPLVESGYNLVGLNGSTSHMMTNIPTGAIIGMVNLVDTFKMGAVWGMIEQNMKISIGGREVDFSEQEIAFGDYSSQKRYGWLLSDPILFKTPIPCKGNLSIWNLPAELEAAVQEQILLCEIDRREKDGGGTLRSVTRHMSLNIAGFLRNNKGKDITGYLSDENGKEMTDADARKYLADCQAKGWKKIPCGDCEGFDHFGGGCPGHTVEEPSVMIASPGEGAVVVEGFASSTDYSNISNPPEIQLEPYNPEINYKCKSCGWLSSFDTECEVCGGSLINEAPLPESKLHLPSRGIDGHDENKSMWDEFLMK